ncbi:MAG: PAS domain-containing protein, partial [Solirubrobacteraceae bacterium]
MGRPGAGRTVAEREHTRGDPGGAEPDIPRLALEHTLDLVSMLDLQGRVVYASPSHTRVLGYTPAELVGMNPLDLVDPRDRHIAAAAIGAEGGLAEPVRMRHRDGRLLIVEGRITAIPGEGGAPRLLLAVSRDVTA